MGIFLGLLAAVTYGAADFVGGVITRRNDVFSVVLLSQFFGVIAYLVAAPFLFTGDLSPAAVALGAGGGVAGATGVLLLYRGLAIGTMSVVAPITAVEAAGVPALFGVAIGERPAAAGLVGVVVALVAVGLISRADGVEGDPSSSWPSSGIAYAVGAGLCFGVFFVLLDQTPGDSGMWPLVASRTASVVFVAIAVVVGRRSVRPTSGSLPMIAAAGILDASANLFFLLASRVGILPVIATLTSMYPAMTVLLARVFLAERLRPTQLVGLMFAAASIALFVLA